MDAQSLVANINLAELTTAAPPLIAWELGTVESEDGVAQFMYYGGPSLYCSGIDPRAEDSRPDKTYWESVKKEMHVFLCTNDKRYRELWKRIDALENKSTTMLVGIIASFLGASIGAPATLLAGFVAVCIYGAAKIGKEAYCRYAGEHGA